LVEAALRDTTRKREMNFIDTLFLSFFCLFYFIFWPVRRTNNTLNLSPYVPFAASSGFFCFNILFRLHRLFDSELIVMDG
jgi:ATP/ADP translocase